MQHLAAMLQAYWRRSESEKEEEDSDSNIFFFTHIVHICFLVKARMYHLSTGKDYYYHQSKPRLKVRAGQATKRPLQLQRAPWPAEGPLESLLASG